jgi:hypothetical protein
MDTVTDTLATVNESTLKAIGIIQEQVLAFNRDIAAAFSRVELPSWMPTPDPSATDTNVDSFVKQAYEFQAQRVEADKKFALDLIDIWTGANRKVVSSSSR